MAFYACHFPPDSASLEDAEVIDTLPPGMDFLDQAVALWRLVNPARADEIAAIKNRVLHADDEHPCFAGDDLVSLVRLIDGVAEAVVVAGIVDDEWRVPPERLDELARLVPGMDLTTERSVENKTNALAEVMLNAEAVRNFLCNALRLGANVVCD